MKATFYNLKLREHEEVEVTAKVIYGDAKRARYAIKALGSGGSKLTKFVSKDVFDAMDAPERDERK
jgi:hypothetical protein